MIQRGGFTFPILSCVFNADGSITHFMHEIDPSLYKMLPNLYAICVTKAEDGRRIVPCGFFVKTSYDHNHDEAEFSSALAGIAKQIPQIAALRTSGDRIVSGRIGNVQPEMVLTEEEMLRLMIGQYLKLSSAGQA